MFNAVGTMGVGVQLAVLLTLTEGLGLNYLVSTVLAVESAGGGRAWRGSTW